MADIRYAKSGDAHIAYDMLGSGPIDIVIVMEGFIPIDMMDDEPHIARRQRRLASFARVIRFDRRGVGLSDPVSPSDPPTLEQWGDDALAVLDAVGSETAVVLSANEASPIAFLLAATHPERVRALVLLNSFARVLVAPDYPLGVMPEELDAMLDAIVDSSPDVDTTASLGTVAPSVAE